MPTTGLDALRADGSWETSGFRADDTIHPSTPDTPNEGSALKEEMGLWLLVFPALPLASGNGCNFSRHQDMPGLCWGQGVEGPDGGWRLAKRERERGGSGQRQESEKA